MATLVFLGIPLNVSSPHPPQPPFQSFVQNYFLSLYCMWLLVIFYFLSTYSVRGTEQAVGYSTGAPGVATYFLTIELVSNFVLEELKDFIDLGLQNPLSLD